MTSRYRVEYALKSHKRDEFIEWIKGLLAVPFVLHADMENYDEDLSIYYKHPNETEKFIEMHEQKLAKTCQTRYLEVFHDVEKLIDNTRFLDTLHPEDPNHVARSRLRQLVPSVGKFFTRLPLKEAFMIEDAKKQISRRRLVSPSFNDVRSILNTAQVLALAESGLKLVTFDGDVTLYEDGKNLEPESPLVECLVQLLAKNLYVAVVTAAGYPGHQGALEYQKRLLGLIETLRGTDKLLRQQKCNFLVMGGESNYLFRFDVDMGQLLFIEGQKWYLPVMCKWNPDKLSRIMDASYGHLKHLQRKFNLDDDSRTQIVRKERSLGIIPVPGFQILRETLEEIVLSLLVKLNEILNEKATHVEAHIPVLSQSSAEHPFTISDEVSGEDIRVCAFNGGSDVWVDIGDKALGVAALQEYLCQDPHHSGCPITKSQSLHIGDQFASVGANDFKARLSACTVWIASPRETRDILEYLNSKLLSGETKV